MDNGVPPVEETTDRAAVAEVEARPVERRATPSRASANGPRDRRKNTSADGVLVERRKSPPRPRKPAVAVASEVTVADRIDPLLAASSAALDETAALVEAKPVRRKAPAAPKPEPVMAPEVAPVAEPATAELPIVDDFFADPNPVKPPARKRPAARVPYVLPKIIPGEPDPEPPEVHTEPDTDTAAEAKPKLAIEAVLAKIGSRITTYRPQFRGATKRLQRSLTPVVLPRHRPRVRRVTRVVRHIDTWSVFKIAVLFNIFLYLVCLTAGAMLWRVALNTGTLENIERFFESFGWQTFEFKGGEIYHNAWIFGLFGVVGMTGLAVLAATMFNLITDLVGGVRVTVLEEEMVARDQRVVTWPRLIRPGTPPGGQPPTTPPSTPTSTPTTID